MLSRSSLRSPAALAVCLAVACGEAESGADQERALDAVRELERLAFVERGLTAPNSPFDVGSDQDLLFDRYEVTWALWESIAPDLGLEIDEVFVPDVPERPAPGEPLTAPRAWRDEIPVTGMTLDEAKTFASSRGMRLPTFEEWMWCALGPRGRILPAGRYQRGLANTADLGLYRATPVGAFESGKTPDSGVYDLVGNVWEWVARPPDPAAGVILANELSWPSGGGTKRTRVLRRGKLLVPGVQRLHAQRRGHGHRDDSRAPKQ